MDINYCKAAPGPVGEEVGNEVRVCTHKGVCCKCGLGDEVIAHCECMSRRVASHAPRHHVHPTAKLHGFQPLACTKVHVCVACLNLCCEIYS